MGMKLWNVTWGNNFVIKTVLAETIDEALEVARKKFDIGDDVTAVELAAEEDN